MITAPEYERIKQMFNIAMGNRRIDEETTLWCNQLKEYETKTANTNISTPNKSNKRNNNPTKEVNSDSNDDCASDSDEDEKTEYVNDRYVNKSISQSSQIYFIDLCIHYI